MPDKFNSVKKGYDPAAVDLYIEELENELKRYKEKDDVIRNAIISAQQAADNIILNAKNQGRTIKENSAKQLEDICLALNAQKQILKNFTEEYQAIMTKYLSPVNNADFNTLNLKIEQMEKYLKNFSDEITEDLAVSNTKNKNIKK